jgi:NAD(P)-dependent dehydrogenase (short-subunit alcohol dehydrogenase family)
VGALELDEAKCRSLAAVVDGPVVRGDATSADDNRAAVGAAVERFGGLDVLVCCVGLFDFYLGLGQIDGEVFDRAFAEAMDVNVRSHLLAVRAAEPHLRRARGSVILTCSTSSFGAGRGGILYVASKFALRGCVVALADELAPEVRVNGVAPGGTAGTDLRGLRSLGLDDRSLGDAPDRAASIRARSPLDVALDPGDVAGSYVFLASDAARGMTGRFLHPDGGANVG